ncbi:MAG: hypothetical protein AB7E31_04320 [Desulfitobacterium sp.]
MKQFKYKGELYNACAPRCIGNNRYTCDAWKCRTGKVVKNHETLNGLGQMLIRGKGHDKTLQEYSDMQN